MTISLLKKKTKSLVALLLAMMFVLMTGCGQKEETFNSEDVVLTFGGEEITLGEVYLYANTVIQDYEAIYGGEIWQTDVSVSKDDSANMEDLTRRDIIEDIVHVKLLTRKAAEYKVALDESDMEQVKRDTETFYSKLTDEQINDMQLSYDLINEVLQENALARKVYDEIIDGADIEVSDEEARETTFYDLYFECYAVASSGDVTNFSEDEKAAQYDRAVQAYNTLINPIESTTNNGTSSTNSNSTNIEGLAEYYGLQNSSYYTMTPSEIKGVYGEDISEMLYGLEDGSYSLVTESDFGYHIFYMKSLTDRDATDARKEDIIRVKKNEYMETLYADWMKDENFNFTYEKSVNFDVYKQIKF